MKTIILLPIIFLLGLSLVSCGGNESSTNNSLGEVSYIGNASQAIVDSDNADELAMAATAGASSSIASEAKPRPSSLTSFLVDHSGQLAQSVFTANRRIDGPERNVCNSGSTDTTYNSDFTQFSIVYDHCSISYTGFGEILIDGRVESKHLTDGSSVVKYIDFSVTYDGESYTLNQILECDADYNCVFYSDYTGPDGRTYRVEDASVSSTGADSYIVSAKVYDPEYGYVTIEARVTYGGCAGGVPISGSITYTGASGSSASVTFNDCDSFTVDDGAISTAYNWADILS